MCKKKSVLNIYLYGGRAAGLPSCRVAGLPSCRVIQYRVAELPAARLARCRVAGLPSCRVAELPGCRVASLPSYYSIAKNQFLISTLPFYSTWDLFLLSSSH